MNCTGPEQVTPYALASSFPPSYLDQFMMNIHIFKQTYIEIKTHKHMQKTKKKTSYKQQEEGDKKFYNITCW